MPRKNNKNTESKKEDNINIEKKVQNDIKPNVIYTDPFKYIGDNNSVLDENGYPTVIPNTNIKINKVVDENQRYLSFVAPELNNCSVRVLKNTPENDKYARRETYLMNKLFGYGITGKLILCVFKPDFIYIVCEMRKTKNIEELYGTVVPQHVFRSIKKLLWFMYNEGFEYSEIVPQNFLVTDDNFLQVINFENVELVRDPHSFKMNEFFQRFVFTDLDTWNPKYYSGPKYEGIKNEFEIKFNYLPQSIKNYTKIIWDKDEEDRQKLIKEEKMYIWDNYPSNFIVGNELCYRLRGIFENIQIPKQNFNSLYGENSEVMAGIMKYASQINARVEESVNNNTGEESYEEVMEDVRQFQEMMESIKNGTYFEKMEQEKQKELEEIDRRKKEREKDIQDQLEIQKRLNKMIKDHEKQQQKEKKISEKKTVTKVKKNEKHINNKE